MKKNKGTFCGREAELTELDELWGKPGATQVLCRWRRRIGIPLNGLGGLP
jgi:hypothetical protein